MNLSVVFLIAGLALVVIGADALVEGASAIARKLGVSEFVIGLTIVGMGTSAPEMVVSLLGAIKGNADIAVGNVVGSNIFNTLLILGLTALILPIGITRNNRRRDIPIGIATTLLVIFLGMDFAIGYGPENSLGRWDGVILLAAFALYIWSCFKFDDRTASGPEGRVKNIWLAILYALGGIAGLVYGGQLFVNSATDIAHQAGVSDKFIAITLLAGGTSLPELATCVVAAAKKRGQLALGNIIGSNVFNLLLILGGAAVINPLSFADMNWIDLGVLVASAVAVFLAAFTFKRDKVDRVDGAFLVALWLAYMVWLFMHM
jgi:cation:H+ antiporter